RASASASRATRRGDLVIGRVVGITHSSMRPAARGIQQSMMESEEAQRLIEKDARNRDVLFPYLNGEDLNSRPDQSPSRWVINFRNWPLRRSAPGRWQGADDETRAEWRRDGVVPDDYPEPVAADYPDCLTIAEQKVKPERDQNKYSRSARERWWLYERWRGELYATIAGMGTSLALTLNSQNMV